MEPSDWQERFSRQTILASVGEAGQRKWARSSLGVLGGGTALESALTALISSGLTRLRLGVPGTFDLPAWQHRFPEADLARLDPAADGKHLDGFLVLTEDEAERRRWSRSLRAQGRPAFFGWTAGSGTALFFAPHASSDCPCFECFEVLNPKTFQGGTAETRRLLGALAAAEVLQWLVKGETPLANQVWITSLEGGLSVRHPVEPSAKCPAGLLARGAKVTP
ncbi:MAG TPA: hypothetical protein VFR02_06255 [bacterium]|nr:hypothetical protein [bacterium]